VSASGNYYAVTTNSTTGCESGTNGVSVTIYALPGAPTMSGGGAACGSTSISASPGNGGNGIRWTDNNTTASPRTVSATGTYYAVTTSVSCGESSANGVSVTIYALPSAPTMSGGGAACGSTSISATTGSNGNGIRWTDNNSTTSSRTVSATGYYYAVTTSASCGESGSAGVAVTIGQPGSADGPPDATCGCGPQLTNLWGTCRTNAYACSQIIPTCIANHGSSSAVILGYENGIVGFLCSPSWTGNEVCGTLWIWDGANILKAGYNCGAFDPAAYAECY
jgi:hypothetical protein